MIEFETPTVEKDYNILLPIFQKNIKMMSDQESFIKFLEDKRPKRSWKNPWCSAVHMVVHRHEKFIKNGKLVAPGYVGD